VIMRIPALGTKISSVSRKIPASRKSAATGIDGVIRSPIKPEDLPGTIVFGNYNPTLDQVEG
jgi:hypothetical protein